MTYSQFDFALFDLSPKCYIRYWGNSHSKVDHRLYSGKEPPIMIQKYIWDSCGRQDTVCLHACSHFFFFFFFSADCKRVYCTRATLGHKRTELVQSAGGPGQRASGTVLVKKSGHFSRRSWRGDVPGLLRLITDGSTQSDSLSQIGRASCRERV